MMSTTANKKPSVYTTTQEQIERLDKIFSPFAPVTRREQFYGRQEELSSIKSALKSDGRHLILYGERGVGKTSIANIVLSAQKDTWIVKITLSHNYQLTEICREILMQLREEILHSRLMNKKQLLSDSERLLAQNHISNNTLVAFLRPINKRILIVLDEFDVLYRSVTSSFAYIIKSFSDNLKHVTFFLIGIANTIDDLISNHYSIERCLLQVRVSRMEHEALSDLIDNGIRQANLFIEAKTKAEIIYFSKGLPYYVQLITKCAAKSALLMKYNTIVHSNLKKGIQEAIHQTHESAALTYEVASAQPIRTKKSQASRSSMYEMMVKACALVQENEKGLFSLADLKTLVERHNMTDNYQKYSHRLPYYIRQLCQSSRGNLLQKIHLGNNTLYRFNNPIVKAYILLKLHQENNPIAFSKKPHYN